MKLGFIIHVRYPEAEGEPQVRVYHFGRLRGGKLIGGWDEDGLVAVLAELEEDDLQAFMEGAVLEIKESLEATALAEGLSRVRADLDMEGEGGVRILVEGVGDTLLSYPTVDELRLNLSRRSSGEPSSTSPSP